MEGFASYFPQAVNRAVPGALRFAPGQTFPLGSIPAETLEAPSCAPSALPLHSIENFVGGALFDIIDGLNFFEPNDRLCRTSDNPIDNKVFQVFDSLELGWTNPTLQDFVNGWINHGFDLPPLLAAFGSTANGLTTPAAVLRYDNAPAANMAIWRPSDGTWWIAGGQNGVPTQWGVSSDIPVPADYDGDGFTDIAVYRPSEGNWYVILSRTNRMQVTQWGQPGDVPLPGDYDADKEVDYAVYRPGTGEVIVHVDGCGMIKRLAFPGVPAGKPVVGDFDGDGDDDAGVYVSGTSTFYYLTSGDSLVTSVKVGSSGIPVIGDYDGDRRSDFGVFSWGTWAIRRSSTLQVTTSSWGSWLDRPVPADYNGDGKTEIATWSQATGEWKINYGPGYYQYPRWGTWDDIPVPAR
jgi:hypothetical protein